MSKKGIAVSQIVLLVLGILVLAVVGYLLYTNFIGAGGSINTERCRAGLITACTSWKVATKDAFTDASAPGWPTLSCGSGASPQITEFGTPRAEGTGADAKYFVQKATCTNVGIT